MHTIDKDMLASNIKQMINLLEYDAMRSPGKAKLNSQHLHSLYFLLDKYEGEAPKRKQTPKKEG